MWVSRNRMDALEREITRLGRKINCQSGLHEWVVRQDSYRGEPRVICEHCYAPSKTLSKDGKSDA